MMMMISKMILMMMMISKMILMMMRAHSSSNERFFYE